ncbi:DUF3631 domain-containing protein [Limnohabitans sp.]|uniref:DUF3631 domain-containing protein n=1 Tax=Limnohabitans sp. TaxID=1907725 RepID=UPI0035B4ACF7
MKTVNTSVQEALTQWNNSDYAPKDNWLQVKYDVSNEAGIWSGRFPKGKDHTGDLVFLVQNTKGEPCSLIAITQNTKEPSLLDIDHLPEGDTPKDAHVLFCGPKDDRILITDNFELALALRSCTKSNVAYSALPESCDDVAIGFTKNKHVVICRDIDVYESNRYAIREHHIRDLPYNSKHLLARTADEPEKLNQEINKLIDDIKTSKDKPVAVDDSGSTCFYRVRNELLRCFDISEDDASIAVAYIFLTYWGKEFLTYIPLLAVILEEDYLDRTAMPQFFDHVVNKSFRAASVDAASLASYSTESSTVILSKFEDDLHNKEKSNMLSEGTSKYSITSVGGGRFACTFGPKIYFTTKYPPAKIGIRSLFITFGENRQSNLRSVGDSKNLLQSLQKTMKHYCKDNARRFEEMQIEPIGSFNSNYSTNCDGILKVAKCLSPEIYQEVRQACTKAMANQISSEEDKDPKQLLADVFEIFCKKGAAKLSTEELLAELLILPESPWANFRGNSTISKKQISNALKTEFNIHSTSVRVGDGTPKGYHFESIEKAYRKYIERIPA